MNRENFNFSQDFEDLIVVSYLNHAEKFYCYGHLLKPEYFSTLLGMLSIKAIDKYQKTYGTSPSYQAFSQFLGDECEKNSVNTKDSAAFLAKLKKIPDVDLDYVIDRVVVFCRERATLNAIKSAARCLKEGTLPSEGFTKLFEEALDVGHNLDDIGYWLHADLNTVVDKVTNPDFGVRTGFPQFDGVWKHGWNPGWLIVPLAPPKRYKTIFSINLARSIVSPAVAEDVIYYSCEISGELAFLRTVYGLSDLTEDVMIDSVESFKTLVSTAIREKVAANLLIKHFSIGTAKISDLEAHCRMVMKKFNIKPRAIVIDYADSVAMTDPSQQMHVQQAAVYKEAIAFGKRVGACIIMPDRCTSDAVDRKVPNLKSFQGAFAKGGIVDISLGLCSTEEEYQQNILRTFTFINRHGPPWQHWRGKVDPAKATIDIGELIPYTPEDEDKSKSSRKNQSSVPTELM